MTNNSDAYNQITEENLRLNEENIKLKEQNEKLFRKFKRIPATVADAYNENIALKEQLKEWDEERIPRLYFIGQLIRGDWSGTDFDGRDVRDWIDFVLNDKYDEFDEEVKPYAGDYTTYQEIIQRKEMKRK